MPTGKRAGGRSTQPQIDENSPSTGHNSIEGLSDDVRFNLLCKLTKEYEDTLTAKREAMSKFTKQCQHIKNELGPDGLEAVEDLIALRTPEGEAKIMNDIRRRQWIGKRVGSPVGLQLELFEVDRTSGDDRAFILGRYHGVAGDPCSPPFKPETSQYQRYMDGYYDGQASLIKAKISPTDLPVGSNPLSENVQHNETKAQEIIQRVNSRPH